MDNPPTYTLPAGVAFTVLPGIGRVRAGAVLTLTTEQATKWVGLRLVVPRIVPNVDLLAKGPERVPVEPDEHTEYVPTPDHTEHTAPEPIPLSAEGDEPAVSAPVVPVAPQDPPKDAPKPHVASVQSAPAAPAKKETKKERKVRLAAEKLAAQTSPAAEKPETYHPVGEEGEEDEGEEGEEEE